MLSTRFTKLAGCTIPIQLAGMGAAGSPELVAAVSEAGGLGMLGTARGGVNPGTFASLLDRIRQLTSRPFGVNFIIRPGGAPSQSRARECVEQAARVARVVEFFYSDPSAEFVQIVHDHGALASWQVGSVDEARKAAAAGCDMIVAQGIEAGGHVRGAVGLVHLLCEVLEAVPEIPVLAAEEADVHPGADRRESRGQYLHAHVPCGVDGSSASRVRSAIEAVEALRDDIVATVTNIGGTQATVPRFAATVADKTAAGHVDAMVLYAGQSVGAVKRLMPAKEIIRDLAEEAEECLRRRIEM
jgi:NAD(P)H-dependent flavin oxidoreductase YrpB (nitropropane dioxygenase family)